jgi:hypothetical protein
MEAWVLRNCRFAQATSDPMKALETKAIENKKKEIQIENDEAKKDPDASPAMKSLQTQGLANKKKELQIMQREQQQEGKEKAKEQQLDQGLGEQPLTPSV